MDKVEKEKFSILDFPFLTATVRSGGKIKEIAFLLSALNLFSVNAKS